MAKLFEVTIAVAAYVLAETEEEAMVLCSEIERHEDFPSIEVKPWAGGMLEGWDDKCRVYHNGDVDISLAEAKQMAAGPDTKENTMNTDIADHTMLFVDSITSPRKETISDLIAEAASLHDFDDAEELAEWIAEKAAEIDDELLNDPVLEFRHALIFGNQLKRGEARSSAVAAIIEAILRQHRDEIEAAISAAKMPCPYDNMR